MGTKPSGTCFGNSKPDEILGDLIDKRIEHKLHENTPPRDVPAPMEADGEGAARLFYMYAAEHA